MALKVAAVCCDVTALNVTGRYFDFTQIHHNNRTGSVQSVNCSYFNFLKCELAEN